MTETVTIPRAEYEALRDQMSDLEDRLDLALIDARRHAPTLSQADVQRILAGTPPLTVWREACGLSAAALAEHARIARATLDALEAGAIRPSLDEARALAQVLGVDVDSLFD